MLTSTSTTMNIDRTLAALADPTRRGVVDLLRKQPRRAGELAEAFQMSPPAMSRHL
ncbi:ArsR family transcriptional regulator, partial [Pyxidicoccus sp. 3LG]